MQRNADSRSLKSKPKKKEQGKYGTYSPKQRFNIEKVSARHGDSKMVAKYSQSSIEKWVKVPFEALKPHTWRRKTIGNADFIIIKIHFELKSNRRGRTFSLALSLTQNCKHLLTISVFQDVL